jgi:hypothetical protein
MTDLEARLSGALKADAHTGRPLPSRDPMFRIEVLARRERDAFRRRLMTSGAMALGTAVVGALALGLAVELVGPGPQRLAVEAAIGAALAALLAAPYLGLKADLRGFAALWRTVRPPRLWP